MDLLYLYLISDSIGETAEIVASSVLSQFEMDDFEIKVYSHVLDETHLLDILMDARNKNSIVLYTLVDEALINKIQCFCLEADIPNIDLLTPLLSAIMARTHLKPLRQPGKNRRLDKQYYNRVSAIEFAVKYDDGKDPRGILKADLVLIGVSRTSKTPLSMFLANKNIKVANIPLVPEVPLPKELYQISPQKIIGLTNSPEKLNGIRQERLHTLGLNVNASYASMERIIEEMNYADSIMKKFGCPVIDVSTKAIEETARLIIEIINNYNSGGYCG